MFKVNDNYLKLPGSYLFSTIGKKVNAYSAAHPDKKIIRLGIGDVTQPLAPAIIDALHGAVDEMGKAETFHGYAPDLGYEFLRNAIAENDYKARGCDIAPDEIFVSDGAKCDCGNIQEIFSLDNKIAVCDPVYPVYVDSNVMAGRTGTYDPKSETWSDVIYMPCLAENGFAPELPASLLTCFRKLSSIIRPFLLVPGKALHKRSIAILAGMCTAHIGTDRVTAYRQTGLSHDVLCFHLTNEDSIYYFFHDFCTSNTLLNFSGIS